MKSDAQQKISIFLVVCLLVFFIVGIASDGFTDFSKFEPSSLPYTDVDAEAVSTTAYEQQADTSEYLKYKRGALVDSGYHNAISDFIRIYGEEVSSFSFVMSLSGSDSSYLLEGESCFGKSFWCYINESFNLSHPIVAGYRFGTMSRNHVYFYFGDIVDITGTYRFLREWDLPFEVDTLFLEITDTALYFYVNDNYELMRLYSDDYYYSLFFSVALCDLSNYSLRAAPPIVTDVYAPFGTIVSSEGADYSTSLYIYREVEAPKIERFSFVGWYYDEAFSIPYKGRVVPSDVELYPKYEQVLFSVTFLLDDEVYDIIDVNYGTPYSDVIDIANAMNLQVMSLSLSDDTLMSEVVDEMNTVIGDLDVTVVIMNGKDKIINTVKNNKWAVVGGLVGIVALVLVVMGISGSVKRKKR